MGFAGADQFFRIGRFPYVVGGSSEKDACGIQFDFGEGLLELGNQTDRRVVDQSQMGDQPWRSLKSCADSEGFCGEWAVFRHGGILR